MLKKLTSTRKIKRSFGERRGGDPCTSYCLRDCNPDEENYYSIQYAIYIG
jgi:hypothetical protein